MKGIAIILLVACAAVGRAQRDECPPEQETDWEIEMLLRHEDCDKFYKCTFGKPVEKLCPADLYFNLETWQCDWRHNVDCTDRNVPSEDSTTVAVTSTEATTTTTPTTTTPTTTTTTTTTPPPTTTTTTTTTTTPAPTTTTTTTESEIKDIEFLDNGCPVDPRIHWLLPHEVNCNLFYYCVWGEKVLRQCPAGLHFNTILQVCDWMWAAGCNLSVNKHLEFRQQIKSL